MQTIESPIILPGRIEFTRAEQDLIERLAAARVKAKDKSIRNNRSDWHDRKDALLMLQQMSAEIREEESEELLLRAYPNMIGIAAEMKFHIITQLAMDLRLLRGGDTTDFNRVEIKGATWPYYDIELKISQEEYKRKFPLVYNLARVSKDYSKVEWIGSISRVRFDRIKYARRHKFNDNWAVCAPDMLRKIAVIRDDVCYLHEVSNQVSIYDHDASVSQLAEQLQRPL